MELLLCHFQLEMDKSYTREQIKYNTPHFKALEKLEELITLLMNIKNENKRDLSNKQYTQLKKLTDIVHDYSINREYDAEQKTSFNSNTAINWATNIMARSDGIYEFDSDDDDFEAYLF